MAGQFISYSRQQKALEEIAELDTVVEEKKKELKKQEEINRFKEQIGGIQTTKDESQREIDLWLGLYIPFKYKILTLLTFAVLILIAFKAALSSDNIIVEVVAALIYFGSVTAIITALVIFVYSTDREELQKNRYNKLKEKTLSTNYTLNSDVIDCPIEVKKELLDRIDNGFVYLSVGFGNHHLYYYSETGYIEKGHSEKGYFGYLPNAFDKEYDYFKDQLTAYKLYKISDIVMDKKLRGTNSV